MCIYFSFFFFLFIHHFFPSISTLLLWMRHCSRWEEYIREQNNANTIPCLFGLTFLWELNLKLGHRSPSHMNREKPTEAKGRGCPSQPSVPRWPPGARGTKVGMRLEIATCRAQDCSEDTPVRPGEGLHVRVSSALEKQSLRIEFDPDVSTSARDGWWDGRDLKEQRGEWF